MDKHLKTNCFLNSFIKKGCSELEQPFLYLKSHLKGILFDLLYQEYAIFMGSHLTIRLLK
jgi:hypothetical protein